MIILLLGPHAAGKTTFGHCLSAHTGWVFHDELGKTLSADPALRRAGVRSSDRQADFDRAVFAAECARDATHRHAHPNTPRIVETWHPGNFAYAATRSPEVALAMYPAIRRALQGQLVIGIPITASDETLAARKAYPEPVSYFRSVAKTARSVAEQLGVTMFPVVDTTQFHADEFAVGLAPQLRDFARDVGCRFATPEPVCA